MNVSFGPAKTSVLNILYILVSENLRNPVHPLMILVSIDFQPDMTE